MSVNILDFSPLNPLALGTVGHFVFCVVLDTGTESRLYTNASKKKKKRRFLLSGNVERIVIVKAVTKCNL